MNLVITKTAFTVTVDFNIYKDHLKIKKASFRRDEISEIVEAHDGNFVTLIMLDGNEFKISFNAVDGAMIVDLIDTFAPISNDDLFDKLVLLQQL